MFEEPKFDADTASEDQGEFDDDRPDAGEGYGPAQQADAGESPRDSGYGDLGGGAADEDDADADADDDDADDDADGDDADDDADDDGDDADDDDDDADDDDDVDEGNARGENRLVGGAAKAVLEHVTRMLVDDPESVVVEVSEGRSGLRFSVHVAQSDMGRIIGRRGRTAQAIRTLVRAAAAGDGVEASVDIVD
ncbi:MAG: KH domain-containing protein [Acidimicrobiales bacterium]